MQSDWDRLRADGARDLRRLGAHSGAGPGAVLGCLPVWGLLLWVGRWQPAWGSGCQAHSKGLLRQGRGP